MYAWYLYIFVTIMCNWISEQGQNTPSVGRKSVELGFFWTKHKSQKLWPNWIAMLTWDSFLMGFDENECLLIKMYMYIFFT